MSTFEQLREGLEQAWDQVTDGWRQLRQRAGQALTRFHPPRRTAPDDSALTNRPDGAVRWSLLAAEVAEHPDAVEVRLEVPGMEADGFDVSVQEQVLVIRGEKHISREQQKGSYLLRERAYGSFERALPLPTPVDDGKAEASYRDGVLTIRLPKLPEATRRRVNVELRQ